MRGLRSRNTKASGGGTSASAASASERLGRSRFKRISERTSIPPHFDSPRKARSTWNTRVELVRILTSGRVRTDSTVQRYYRPIPGRPIVSLREREGAWRPPRDEHRFTAAEQWLLLLGRGLVRARPGAEAHASLGLVT